MFYWSDENIKYFFGVLLLRRKHQILFSEIFRWLVWMIIFRDIFYTSDEISFRAHIDSFSSKACRTNLANFGDNSDWVPAWKLNKIIPKIPQELEDLSCQ